jgi:DnaJ-class molecular chaperone
LAERTLYDILEVSNSASAETIRAAYDRLAGKYDAAAGNADARFQHEAVKDAFFTLSNAERRAAYDKKLELRAGTAIRNIEVIEPFWTLPKMIVVGVVALALGGFYYKHQ